MSTCPLCTKPLATLADYDALPGVRGGHLCWANWSACERAGDEMDVIAQLRAEVEQLRVNQAANLQTKINLHEHNKALQAEVALLRDALDEFGQHHACCNRRRIPNADTPCICGLSDALASPSCGNGAREGAARDGEVGRG